MHDTVVKGQVAVNLDFSWKFRSTVLNNWNHQFDWTLRCRISDLVEKGEKEIGLRQLRYGDIAKTEEEHYQLMGAIYRVS
ncbi:MAG: hypothetical protein U0176_24430 [Bacteroidia bacterium]